MNKLPHFEDLQSNELEILAIENTEFLFSKIKEYSDITNYTDIYDKSPTPPKGYRVGFFQLPPMVDLTDPNTWQKKYCVITKENWKRKFMADKQVKEALYWEKRLESFRKQRYNMTFNEETMFVTFGYLCRIFCQSFLKSI